MADLLAGRGLWLWRAPSLGEARSLAREGHVGLTAVPSLDDLAADPGKAARLPGEVRQALILRCAVVLSALASCPVVSTNGTERLAPEPDRLLTPEEAAALLQTTVPWLYRHHKQLPFARPLSRKRLRFSEAGLGRWLAAKRA